jgi:hypothetical protein
MQRRPVAAVGAGQQGAGEGQALGQLRLGGQRGMERKWFSGATGYENSSARPTQPAGHFPHGLICLKANHDSDMSVLRRNCLRLLRVLVSSIP